MCATNLWAVNAATFTPAFRAFTVERIGVEPELSPMRIASERVRGSSVVFTLTSRMCDCDSLIGRRSERAHDDEASAEAWLGWMRELADHAPHISRLAVLRAWSPQDDDVVPARARGIGIGEVSEEILRDVRDDMLLTIDYPRVV